MKLDRNQIEADFRALIGPLCDAVGPSGFEDEVADLLRKELADCDVELSDDVMGNLIAYKKGNKRGSVLIAAHMDEIGLIVRHIDSKGFLWVETLGGIAPQQFFGKRRIHSEGDVGISDHDYFFARRIFQTRIEVCKRSVIGLRILGRHALPCDVNTDKGTANRKKDKKTGQDDRGDFASFRFFHRCLPKTNKAPPKLTRRAHCRLLNRFLFLRRIVLSDTKRT